MKGWLGAHHRESGGTVEAAGTMDEYSATCTPAATFAGRARAHISRPRGLVRFGAGSTVRLRRIFAASMALTLVPAGFLGYPLKAQASTTVLSETFEGGAPGWTVSGFWHIQDHPEAVRVLTPQINPTLVTLPDAGSLPPANSGTHVAWFGEPSTGTFCGSDFNTISQSPKGGCTSTQIESGDLTSPVFSLAGASTAEVAFAAWWEIESVNADTFDVMNMQYTIDGGTTWTNVGKLNPANNPAGNEDQSYSNEGLEKSPTWHRYVADLSPAAGQTSVQVRWDFNTHDNLYNGFRGLIVDDVTVSTPFAQPPPVITSLSPGCVIPAASTVIDVHGTNFVLGSQLTVDGSQVPTFILSNSLAEFTAGSLASGSHAIVLTSPNGTSSNAATLISSTGSCSTAPCTVSTLPGTNEPALVAVMVDGVQTSSPSEDFYPTDFGFNGTPNHAAIDSYCSPYAASYGSFPLSVSGVLNGYQGGSTLNPQPPQGIETLTDQLALQGAVLLPYSYQGAYFSSWPIDSAQPLFHVNYSAVSDPGNTSVNQQAGFLWGEVQSIHKYWPDAALEIIADSGGGVPAEYYWNTAFQQENDGVSHIFTLDAPINGLDHTFLESLIDSHLGPVVRDFYGLLWQNMDSNNQNELQLDSDGSFRPIGTIGDYAFALGDVGIVGSGNQGQNAEVNALLSQLLMQCTGGLFDTCTPQIPPDFLSPCSGDLYGFTDASHEVVRVCKPTVDYITGITGGDQQLAIANATAGSTNPRGLAKHSPLRGRAVGSSPRQIQLGSGGAKPAPMRHVPTIGAMTQPRLLAAAIGQVVTIGGSGLGATPGTVSFTGSGGPGTIPGAISFWSDSAVSVVVPSGAVSGPMLLRTAGGDGLLADEVAVLTFPTGVASLSAKVIPKVPGGQPEQIKLTAVGVHGRPVTGATVELFNGSIDALATTNGSGVAVFSISGFGTQEFLAHSGNVASPLITVNWYPVSGPTFTPIQPLTPACISTITGRHTDPLTVRVSTCIDNARLRGRVTVMPGASIEIANSLISGGVLANRPADVTLCNSQVAGDGSDDYRAGFGCGPNTITGGVSIIGGMGGAELAGDQLTGLVRIANNVGGGPDLENAQPEIEGNTITGSLTCAGNNPSPTSDGQPNIVVDPEDAFLVPSSGQCGQPF
jgi:Immune inhibitor A peptidase M6/IPT/TIG domain